MKDINHTAKSWATRVGLALLISTMGIGVINSKPFDESLDPELQAYLSLYPNSDVHDNAFSSMYGLMADSGMDMHSVGKSVVDALKAKRTSGLHVALDEEEMTSLTGPRLLEDNWREHLSTLNCLPGTFDTCWEEIIEEVRETPLNDANVRTLIQRYELIISMPHHIEFLDMDMYTPLPDYHELLAIGKLRQAELVALGDEGSALAALRKEMKFWRMVLNESQSVVGKMLAVRGLADRIQYVSDILIPSSKNISDVLNSIEPLISPLSASELDISESVLHDLRVVYSMQELESGVDHGKIGGSLIAWTLQEVASYNTYFKHFIKPSMALSALDSASFKRERALFHVGLPKASDTFLPNLYNPGGELIVSELYFDESPYMARVHDLNAMLILLNLKVEIAQNPHRPAEDIIKVSRYKNPYNGQSFSYDGESNTIRFNCESNFTNCTIRL